MSSHPNRKANKAAHKKQPPKPTPPKAKSLGAKVIEGVGASLGNLVGLKDVGRSAGSWLSKVVGLGAYKLHQNSFTKSSDDVPQFEFGADGSVTITHREFVRDIVGSTAFSYFTLDICPSNIVALPWLCVVAQLFGQYEFLGFLACYVPTSGDAIASTNNALGSMITATEYDVSRRAFSTKAEMEQSTFVTSDKPSEPQIHPVECNPHRDTVNARYMDGVFRTRAAATDAIATSALTFTDPGQNLRCTGRLQVATTGQQAATTIGELWFTYKVKFMKPRGLPPGAEGGLFHAAQGLSSLASGDAQFADAIVCSDSTAMAAGIGLSSDGTTITFYGERPGTLVRVTLAAIVTSGNGDYTFGTVTPTSMSAFIDNFSTGTGGDSGPFLIDQTTVTSTRRCLYYGAFEVTSSVYTVPAKLVFGNPTISGGATYKFDLRVHREPAWYPINTALSMEREVQLHQVIDSYLSQRAKSNAHELDEKYVVIPKTVQA